MNRRRLLTKSARSPFHCIQCVATPVRVESGCLFTHKNPGSPMHYTSHTTSASCDPKYGFCLLHASRQDTQISIACPRELTVDSLLSALLRDSDRAMTPGQETLMRSACG